MNPEAPSVFLAGYPLYRTTLPMCAINPARTRLQQACDAGTRYLHEGLTHPDPWKPTDYPKWRSWSDSRDLPVYFATMTFLTQRNEVHEAPDQGLCDFTFALHAGQPQYGWRISMTTKTDPTSRMS